MKAFAHCLNLISPGFFRRLPRLIAALTLSLSPAQAAQLPVDEALPLVGTGGHGHTYPGATVPFGFVQVSPDTRTEGWDACSGYHYSDGTIMGFSHTHLSGTGCPDLADVLLMPVAGSVPETGSAPLNCERFKSEFAHEREHAEPGYYRVQLDKYQVLAELSATAHAAIHRYTFPATGERHVLIDLVHGVGNQPVAASLQVESDTVVSGHRRSNGWAHNREIYFVIETSQPFLRAGLELDGAMLPVGSVEAAGKNVRAQLVLPPDSAQPVILRVGLSPTSVAAARKNLQAEIPGADFDAVRNAARNTWNGQLSRIKIESSNPAFRQTFYTALYHVMTAPTLYNDADGSYVGPDQQVVAGAAFQNYSTFSLWDTFRAEHPLLTVMAPERVNDFIEGMLAFYRHSPDHALPMWPLANTETWCMIAYHSAPVIWDAYQKGFRNFDASLALSALVATAQSDRTHQDEYKKYNYVPISEPGKGNESASRTMEFAYDDWCIAQLAGALGRTNEAALFGQRARNYRNVFDPQTGFFRGRTPAGVFPPGFDPKAISFDDYTEANAWQYAFSVFHDVPDMIRLYGGQAAFIAKLDQLFEQDSDMASPIGDVTGIVGQYAHGNEPCHHVAYLYSLAGAPYKTARRVRQIMLMYYDNTPEGICGNDDCGQMSAWYVWSALGLYPVNPADGVYVIGSPMVEKATLALDPKFYPGGTFTIVAHNASKQNCYVQSARLNGQPLQHPWITHAELIQGGTLEFEMGVLPNKAWGATPAP